MRATFRLLAFLVALAPGALANGRFPRAQRVLEDPNDPARLVVGATYGMLTTDDGGASWHVVCESSFAGIALGSFDCMFERTESGALLASFGDAMARADMPYCDFSRVLGGDMQNRVIDFSVLPSAPNDVLAILTRRVDGRGISVLARSTDAGKSFAELGAELPEVTWQELLHTGAKLYGFALSPSGDRVLAGFGDPRDVTIDPDALGIYSATMGPDSIGDFSHVTTKAVSCLTWTARGLYVCATDFEVGFHLGFREDADLTGGLERFTVLLQLPQVLGPLECPPETSGARCAADWPATCTAFAASCAGAAGTGGTAGAGGNGDGANGGTPASGGATGGKSEPLSRSSEGCNCHIATTSTPRGFSAALVALLLVARRRRSAHRASPSARETERQRHRAEARE